MKEVLRDFKKKLRDKGIGEGSINTHVRRANTYLRWCTDGTLDPLDPDSGKAFMKSREDSGVKETTLAAYSHSVKTFLRLMRLQAI